MNTKYKIISVFGFIFLSSSPLFTITSCSQSKPWEPDQNNLENECNAYCDQYNMNFINNLSWCAHDYTSPSLCPNLYCESQAEAVYIWCHYGAYSVWNHYLHDGRGSTSALDNDKVVRASISYQKSTTPYDDEPDLIWGDIRLKDYKWLDSALKLSTAGKKIRVYHGLEKDESDLVEHVNNCFGVDIKNDDPKELKEKIDLNKIVNTSYIDYAYLATSFNNKTPFDWASGAQFKTSIVLDLDIDPNTYCAYVSYTKKKWWHGVFLANPRENQILIDRKSKIVFRNASIIDKNGQSIIVLKGDVFRGEQDTY